MGKSGRTAGAVATHFSLAAVSVKKPPAKITGLGSFNENKPIGAGRHPPPANANDETGQIIIFDPLITVVDDNKIIAGPAHLVEWYGVHILPLSTIEGEDRFHILYEAVLFMQGSRFRVEGFIII
jgi:hypothetical protein